MQYHPDGLMHFSDGLEKAVVDSAWDHHRKACVDPQTPHMWNLLDSLHQLKEFVVS